MITNNLTNTIIIGARLEPIIAVAHVGAGHVLTGAVPAQRARPRALVHVAARAVAESVAGLALASVLCLFYLFFILHLL